LTARLKQNLFKLHRIGAHGTQPPVVTDFQRDLLAQQPLERCRTSATTSGNCRTCGRSVCCREKASNWRVRLAARLELALIC
jgi:hypothetical protein